MSDHIKIDLPLLAQTGGELADLRREFANAGSIVDANSDAVGAPELVAALHSFADNWKYHKEKLLSAIDSVTDMVDTSHDTYVATDGKLAGDAHSLVGGS